MCFIKWANPLHNSMIYQRKSAVFRSARKQPHFQTVASQLQVHPDDTLIQVICFSLDPIMRVWMSGAKTNFRVVQPGDIFNCFGLGRVIQSSSYTIGDYVFGNTGTTNYFILDEAKEKQCFVVDTKLVQMYGPEAFVYLINNALAAFAGFEALNPQKDENVVVSTAAGATGLLLCHLLKQQGSTIIAITSKSKATYLKDYSTTILDYNSHSFASDLKAIKFRKYFDNVGEKQLDLVLSCIGEGGILALCGAIGSYSQYKSRGILNYTLAISKRLQFVGINFYHLIPRAAEIFKMFANATLCIEMIRLEQFSEYLQEMFRRGGSVKGKIIVRI